MTETSGKSMADTYGPLYYEATDDEIAALNDRFIHEGKLWRCDRLSPHNLTEACNWHNWAAKTPATGAAGNARPGDPGYEPFNPESSEERGSRQ